MTLFPRSSGILLHPTSLPGRYGIGDLGRYAYRFADWLHEHGQSNWQILPLGPTSYGDSPYQCLSAFAGNTNLISLDKLAEDGWLAENDLADCPEFPTDYVDYGPVIEYHNAKLRLAFEQFDATVPSRSERSDFTQWCDENAYWLDDYVLFIALKNHNGGRPWVEWKPGLALRDPGALGKAADELAGELVLHKFLQWQFFRQWHALKEYANGLGIRFIGDIPIFVAHDSSDVWANRDRFYLDDSGNPTIIAGVPPDYFSETGQRWGNPLYRWDVMKSQGYDWWVKRLSATLELVDLVRIDHFRGFEAYWQIPAEEETAINGQWVKGPNIDLFNVLKEKLGDLPIIAEDLGEITKEVIDLRDSLGLPGMKILQFAWSDPKNPFQPHNYSVNCVAYTGTHDNNTTVGWWNGDEATDHIKQRVRDYLGHEVHQIDWTMICLGMMSVAHTFVMPLQDILGLGAEARMNTPGKEQGNWGWRFVPEDLNTPGKDRLAHLTWLYRRRPDQQEEVYGDVARQ